jgi:hypothetical protein
VIVAAILVLLVLLGAAPAAAQIAPGEADPSLDTLEHPVLPDPYHDPARAVAVLARLRAGEPGRLELHLAAARELTALGILERTREDRIERLRQAEAAARAALALDSASAPAHYWLAAALGLIADESGGLTKISSARSAHAEVVAALALDPHHAGARHILGRMHMGVLRLGRINRLIARGLGLGPLLSQASWQSAEENLRMSLAADPEPWVYTIELAKLLTRRGGDDEARALLEQVAVRAPRHDLDAHYQEEARILLRELIGP